MSDTEYVELTEVRIEYVEVAGGVPGPPVAPATVAAAVADYFEENPIPGAEDATAVSKGVVQLAGDLGGTADAPTVPGLADKANTDDLGTAAAEDSTAFATAAQGELADSAVQGDDPRLSDARTPLAHTHTSASVTDFTEAVHDAVAALLAAGTNVTLNYDDAGDTLTVSASGGGSFDAEAARDALGVALVGLGNISIVVNDALDTITISTTATVNATDAALRDRSTHTGTQAASTISDFTAAVIAALPAASATASGIVELATTAEATTGTDTTRAVTPAGLKAVADTKADSSHSHTSAQVTDFAAAAFPAGSAENPHTTKTAARNPLLAKNYWQYPGVFGVDDPDNIGDDLDEWIRA